MILHDDDWDSVLENAKFMQDTELFRRVYEKIKKMRLEYIRNNNFTTYEPDDTETLYKKSPDFQLDYLVTTWLGLYLNHPEFAEKVRSEIPKNLVQIFEEFGLGYYRCRRLGKNDAKQCNEKMMANYEQVDYANLIVLLEMIKRSFPPETVRIVIEEYMEIYSFYTQVILQNPSLLRDSFTQDEKEFILTWAESRQDLISNDFYLDDLVENAKLMQDTEIFRKNKITY